MLLKLLTKTTLPIDWEHAVGLTSSRTRPRAIGLNDELEVQHRKTRPI